MMGKIGHSNSKVSKIHFILMYPPVDSRERSVIMEAIADYAKYTCVRFRPKMSSDGDYLRIFKGEGCWSYVGRQGGMQELSIGNGCGIV